MFLGDSGLYILGPSGLHSSGCEAALWSCDLLGQGEVLPGQWSWGVRPSEGPALEIQRHWGVDYIVIALFLRNVEYHWLDLMFAWLQCSKQLPQSLPPHAGDTCQPSPDSWHTWPGLRGSLAELSDVFSGVDLPGRWTSWIVGPAVFPSTCWILNQSWRMFQDNLTKAELFFRFDQGSALLSNSLQDISWEAISKTIFHFIILSLTVDSTLTYLKMILMKYFSIFLKQFFIFLSFIFSNLHHPSFTLFRIISHNIRWHFQPTILTFPRRTIQAVINWENFWWTWGTQNCSATKSVDIWDVWKSLSDPRCVPSSVVSRHLSHWHSNIQLSWISCLLMMLLKRWEMYWIEISSPLLISLWI